MASTTSILRASRPMFGQNFRATFGRQGQQQFTGFRFQQGGRRWQSTGDAAGQQQQASWFKRMWESEIGFKTVHFW